MKIAIIGAGPIGCYTAYLLSKSGHHVEIYEEHPQIGNPIQCTGLLTPDFDQFNFDMSSFLVNTFEELTINSKNNSVKIKQKEYLVCRTKFDQFFGKMAKDSGVKIFLSHSFIRKEGAELIIKDLIPKTEKRVTPDIVIASDGPLSKVAKSYGFFNILRKNYFGIQAVVEGDFKGAKYEVFFGEKVCPDLFAWVVPESDNQARVGLASKTNSKFLFDNFIKKHNFKILHLQAGTIPIYSPKQILKFNNCYLVGDSAGQVKATTLGGLVPGLCSAKVLVDCINNGGNYKRKSFFIRLKLYLHLQIHKILEKFTDKDWDLLLSLFQTKRVKRVLGRFTRDNPLPLALNLVIVEPRLLYFVIFLFKRKKIT